MSYSNSTPSLNYTTHGYRNTPEPDQQTLLSIFKYEDGNLLWRYSPTSSKTFNTRFSNKPAGTKRSDGYIAVKVGDKLFKLHRLIFCYHHGYYPTIVDHISRDISDNSIENLRASTARDNALNKKKKRPD